MDATEFMLRHPKSNPKAGIPVKLPGRQLLYIRLAPADNGMLNIFTRQSLNGPEKKEMMRDRPGMDYQKLIDQVYKRQAQNENSVAETEDRIDAFLRRIPGTKVLPSSPGHWVLKDPNMVVEKALTQRFPDLEFLVLSDELGVTRVRLETKLMRLASVVTARHLSR